MKEFILNYYPQFKCIAEKCQHTCCAGWEMYIDRESIEKYKKESSCFSSSLKRGIDFKKSKFRADKKGRCAFLNDKGLCKIIINLGENALCQVCRDHPRFRSFFNDRVEMGLGFSCEQATRIILSFKGKIEPIETSSDGNYETLDFNQNNLLEFRNKALSIIQDRSESITDRIDNLLKLSCAQNINFNKVIKRFLSFERLDNAWAKRLKAIKKQSFIKETEERLSLYAEQFLVNSIYRHFYDAEDTMWVRARLIACVLSWWVIKSIILSENGQSDFERIVDVVRAFSSEVEYSESNLDKLFNFAYKFINI